MAIIGDMWNPVQYAKFKNERSQPFYDLIDEIEKKNNLVAADLGCGTGALTHEAFRILQPDSLVGIDNSPNMLEESQKAESEKLTFRLMQIEDFYFPNGFDLIFSNAALHWCADHATLFSRLKESLKPGGQLAVQIPFNHDFVTHRLAALIADREDFHGFLGGRTKAFNGVLTPQEYSIMMYDLKFSKVRIETRVYGHVLEKKEQVLDWVRGTLLTYYKAQMPKAVYDSFLALYQETLYSHLDDTKPFLYPYQRLFIWASV